MYFDWFDQVYPERSRRAQYRQKGFAPVLVLVGILVLAVVVGGAYYFGKSQTPKPQLPNPVVTSPTPQTTPSDETANWKTYTNNQYNFQFKYPLEGQITESFKDRVSYMIGKIIPIPEACPEFSFTVVFSGSELDYKMPDDATAIEIDGRPAVRVEYSSNLEGYPCRGSKIAVLDQNNPAKTTLVIYISRQSDKYPDLFDQILSTFRFLP